MHLFLMDIIFIKDHRIKHKTS